MEGGNGQAPTVNNELEVQMAGGSLELNQDQKRLLIEKLIDNNQSSSRDGAEIGEQEQNEGEYYDPAQNDGQEF